MLVFFKNQKSNQIYYTNLIYISGTILQVECASRNSKSHKKIVPSTANRVTINGLRSGTLFNCSISASTNQGSGPVKSIRVWTKSIGTECCNDLKDRIPLKRQSGLVDLTFFPFYIDPIQPPAPVILERSTTTITVSLQPLEDENIR